VFKTLQDLLSRLTEVRVLVVGDLLLDEYVVGESSRISSEAPVPVVQFQSQHAVPGGAANTAANVASLGASATLIGLVSADDLAGRELRRLCADLSIRLIGIDDGRPTTRKVRVLGQHQQLLRLDYEDVSYIRRDIEERVLREFAREVPHADIVIVSDYAKGLLTARLCQQVIALSHARGKQVVIDPRPQHASHYADCDYLTPNWRESQRLLGRAEGPASDEEIESTGRLLSTQFRSSVLVTLGARGIAFFPREGGECFRVAAAAKEVFDVSGAGDTVVAAFALAQAAGAAPFDAVSFANRAAGIVVAKRGTATASPEEFLALDHAEAGLVERDGLRGLCLSLRAKSRRIVTATGVFDQLHRGHLAYLRRARREGDVLIVGLRQHASAHRAAPESTDRNDRAEMLLTLRPVDFVHVFAEEDASTFLEAVGPDVHVVSAEFGVTPAEAAAVERSGGRVLVIEPPGDAALESELSSSPVLDAVRSLR
jgi:D-beta-D-heptose 7-phosphate kinase / D-beta-D-heptose 1-phosphate adenosyltransferase